MTVFHDLYPVFDPDQEYHDQLTEKQIVDTFTKRCAEYKHECWLMEGFPKTHIQGLALSKNKVVPDRIFLVKYSDEIAIEFIISKLREVYPKTDENMLRSCAEKCMEEYHMNIKGIHKLFGQVMHVVHGDIYIKGYNESDNKISHFVDEVSRLITIKRNNPRRPPSFIIIGAPGSGRSTQAKIISKHYGLVHISTLSLLKNEIRLGTERGKRIKESFKQHKMVPDEIICSLVEARIKRND